MGINVKIFKENNIRRAMACMRLLTTLRAFRLSVPYAKVMPDFTLLYNNNDVVKNKWV